MARRMMAYKHKKSRKAQHYGTEGGPVKELYLPFPKHMKGYPGLPGVVRWDDDDSGYYTRRYDDENDAFYYVWIESPQRADYS